MKQLATLSGHESGVNIAKYNKDGEYLLSGSNDKLIKLWKPQDKTLLKTYSGHGWQVSGLAVFVSFNTRSSDNSKFCSCGGDKSVFLWDVSTGTTIRKYSGHYQRVNDVDFNQQASIIASGSYDATVRLWDIRSVNRNVIQTLSDAKDSITSVQISKKEILTASVDGHLRTYDIRMGSLLTDKVGVAVSCATFSIDATCMLASCLDSTMRLFDRSTGELLQSFKGHVNTDYSLRNCFLRNDSQVCTGSEDGNVFIWDLVDASVKHSFSAHYKSVMSVEPHPKEPQFATSSSDSTIKIWDLGVS